MKISILRAVLALVLILAIQLFLTRPAAPGGDELAGVRVTSASLRCCDGD
jgi:hypothetical protein